MNVPVHPMFPHWCMVNCGCSLVAGHTEPCRLDAGLPPEGGCGLCLACAGPPPPDPLAAVQALIDRAKQISPSDRMTVYVGDLEHALGRRDEPARTRTGGNE